MSPLDVARGDPEPAEGCYSLILYKFTTMRKLIFVAITFFTCQFIFSQTIIQKDPEIEQMVKMEEIIPQLEDLEKRINENVNNYAQRLDDDLKKQLLNPVKEIQKVMNEWKEYLNSMWIKQNNLVEAMEIIRRVMIKLLQRGKIPKEEKEIKTIGIEKDRIGKIRNEMAKIELILSQEEIETDTSDSDEGWNDWNKDDFK